MIYTLQYTAEQRDNLPNWISTEKEYQIDDFYYLQLELTDAQATDLACLKQDGLIVNIVPPEGEPDPQCDRPG